MKIEGKFILKVAGTLTAISLVVAALLGSGSISLPIWAWTAIGVAGLLIFVLAMKYSAQIEDALLRFVRRIVPKKNRTNRN